MDWCCELKEAAPDELEDGPSGGSELLASASFSRSSGSSKPTAEVDGFLVGGGPRLLFFADSGDSRGGGPETYFDLKRTPSVLLEDNLALVWSLWRGASPVEELPTSFLDISNEDNTKAQIKKISSSIQRGCIPTGTFDEFSRGATS